MTFEIRDDHQLTLRINRLEPDYPGQTVAPAIWIETSDGFFSRTAVKVPADRVEEVVAGIRDAARTAARQTTGQDDTERTPCSGPVACGDEPCDQHEREQAHAEGEHAFCGEECPAVGQPDPTTADDPVPLRWGLGDVIHGDDDSVIVCLSGPDREPYWLELDAERAAAFRRDLTPPAAEDTIGLCGYCGVPRENHHHGYTSTADVIAASPYSRTDDEAAPAVGQPVAWLPPMQSEAATRLYDAARAKADEAIGHANGCEWHTNGGAYCSCHLWLAACAGIDALYGSGLDAADALAVGQPAEAHDTDTSTWWTIQAQKPTGTWFNLSEGFSSADEARTWRDTEITEPRNWPLRIVRVDQTETVAVEDER